MNAIVDANARRNQLCWMIVCIGCFAVADTLLVSRAWFFEGKYLFAAMAVPLSQCSLASIWSCCSRATLYLRFAASLAAAIGSWLVLTRILTWGIGDPVSAAWALAIAIQLLSIVLMIDLYKRGRRWLGRDSTKESGTRNCTPSPFAFDLRTLMLWTTAIALGFGFTQFAHARWRWSGNLTDWDFIDAMPIVGVGNALLSVIWLWALAVGSWQRRSMKAAGVLLFVGILGYLMSAAITWSTGVNALESSDCLTLLISQSVLVAGTIILVNFAARRRLSNEIAAGSRGVTP